ncbi:hypothetical protein SELMODRAFT_438017 [Selaginella moellendorffii]|uniref:F-box protein At3g26010-like beta-propeller domain-containing protein n=1 Tax=Selaginella moellendorffii TaxID=88036 RepID=D8QSS6_SELML|nr:hypothetical protein SELMODRAFT_438017 [Selaginella moellendorffii]
MRLENHTELWRPHSLQRKRCSLPLGPSGSRFVGLCSSNGLVCGMLMEHTDWMTFAVGNPITNVWKTLPPAPLDPADRLQPALDRLQPAYLDIGMETDAVSSSYQLAILYQKIHDDDDKIFSLQYESDSCSWHQSPFFSTSSSSNLSGSPLRGCAFFYTGENIFPAYDPHSRTWSHAVISPPARNEQEEEDESWANWSFGYIGAFMYKGKCYLASLLFEDVWSGNLGDETGKLNVGVGVPVRDKDLKVRLVGDTAFISAFYRKESPGVWPPVAYDFALSKWYTCCCMESEDIECSYVLLSSLSAKP